MELKHRCRYCGEEISPEANPQCCDTKTGEHFHIECFIENDPRGQEIFDRAQEMAEEACALASSDSGRGHTRH